MYGQLMRRHTKLKRKWRESTPEKFLRRLPTPHSENNVSAAISVDIGIRAEYLRRLRQ
jgi:hypothetical protein